MGRGRRLSRRIAKALPHEVTIVGAARGGGAMNEIADGTESSEMASGAYGAGPLFVFVNGLHKFKKLRHEEDFSFSMGDGERGSRPRRAIRRADPGRERVWDPSAGRHRCLQQREPRFISRKGIRNSKCASCSR